jgi:AraC-like DNA-binding protein
MGRNVTEIEIVLSSAQGKYKFLIEDPISAAILVTIDDFMKDYHRAGTNKTLLLSDYVKILLIKIDRAVILHSSDNNDNANQRVFQKFIFQIEQDFLKTRKVADYCQRLGVSPRKLSQVCIEFRSQSAKNILDERLISESKYFLMHTNYPIKYIALLMAFSDQYQFSKYFKKHMRISPTQFREEHTDGKHKKSK